ncbi:MAG: hypothetical protein KJ600_03430 [Nanoarchaeota archaeon]|nr:hypothetical protein [Nanoarchaeota archaeon]MBU1103579.1 hypothetical protein [Nanoarchaeota archaeon]
MLQKTNPQKNLIKLPIAEDKIKRQSLSTTPILPFDSGLCDNLEVGRGDARKYIFTQSQQAGEVSHQLNSKASLN